MTAKIRFAENTVLALKLVEGGMTPYAAAKEINIETATIYNAIKRLRSAGFNSIEEANAPVVKHRQAAKVANFSVKNGDIELFDKAADLIGVSRAEFMRNACIEKANQIIDSKN